MSDIKVAFENWISGDPSWLRVIIEHTGTGEVVSAFTKPAPAYQVQRLREDLDAGRAAQTDLEFVNYFCPAPDPLDETNDDLNLVRITGSLEQVAGETVPEVRIQVSVESLFNLVKLILADRSAIDIRLLEMLSIVAPDSLAACADDIVLTRRDPNEPSPPDRQFLTLDEKTRTAKWKRKNLGINANTDFDLLLTLHSANGAMKSHGELLRAIRPGAVSTAACMSETPQEVKDAVAHIRSALRLAGCPLWIQCVKRKGFRLASPAD